MGWSLKRGTTVCTYIRIYVCMHIVVARISASVNSCESWPGMQGCNHIFT